MYKIFLIAFLAVYVCNILVNFFQLFQILKGIQKLKKIIMQNWNPL